MLWNRKNSKSQGGSGEGGPGRPRTRRYAEPQTAQDRETFRRTLAVKQKISSYVHHARRRCGWTQAQLAAKMNVSQAWLSMVENPNDPSHVPMHYLELVAEVTGIPYLLLATDLVAPTQVDVVVPPPQVTEKSRRHR